LRLCALAPLSLLLFACTRTPNVSQAPPMKTQTQASGPRVIFPDGYIVHVEIAANDELRAQGLMFRDQLRPASGMLFFFTEDGEYPFWMKNTHIPLDMIWIDSGKRIAHVAHDVPPCRIENCPNYPPHAIARYVLEVAAGVAKQHGLKDGDVLRFEGTENVVAQ
jgi:uncharacterized membrane protein (UPF0127 family)